MYTIRSVQHGDEDKLREYFRVGLMGYAEGGTPGFQKMWRTYVDESIATDFQSICSNYGQRPGSGYYVAVDSDGTIAGGVGLHPISVGDPVYAAMLPEAGRATTGELRRMTVRSGGRRGGVGRRLVHHLEEAARTHGYETIHLTTAQVMTAAWRLYEACGYTCIWSQNISSEGKTPFYVLHYMKSLRGAVSRVAEVTPAEPLVLYDLTDHVATITYNRPSANNAINGAMRVAINDAWARFRDDPEAWVAILTHTGRHFCVGMDLSDSKGAAGEFPGTFFEKPTLNSFESGWEIFKPTVCAVRGRCVGYGVTGAAFCDFLVASESATFAYPEVKVGMPTIVGSIRLPQKIGWSNAMELLMLGDAVDATRARELGLVWRVVPDDQLMVEARKVAQRLCNAPLAMRAVKEVAWRTRSMGWVESVRFGETLRRVVNELDGKGDLREGVAAFREKRPPNWQGAAKL